MRTYKDFIKFCTTFSAIKPQAKDFEILIYGPILDSDFWGEDVVTPKSVMEQLDKMNDAEEITIRINSPGGFVTEGIAIYNALNRHPAKMTVHVDGMAASAASVVAMAGDRIVMPDNSTMMIHKVWTLMIGNSDDLLKEAEILELLDGNIANVYAARTGKTRENVLDWMKEETWFDAESAVENGFADEVVKSKEKPEVRADLAVYSNVPGWVEEMYGMDPPPHKASPFAKATGDQSGGEVQKNEPLQQVQDDNIWRNEILRRKLEILDLS